MFVSLDIREENLFNDKPKEIRINLANRARFIRWGKYIAIKYYTSANTAGSRHGIKSYTKSPSYLNSLVKNCLVRHEFVPEI